LDLKGSQTMKATSVITGAGSLSKSADGTTVIQGTSGVGGPLTVSGGTLRFDTGGGVTLSGLTLTGGALTVASPLAVTGTFVQSGGTLNGTNTLTVAGLMTWTAGTQAGSGETVAAGGLLLEGDSVKDLQSRSLTLDGPSTWAAGQIRLWNGGTLTNNSTFDIQTDADLQHTSGAISTFINNGTVSKTAGTATTGIEAHTVNTGTIEVLAGAIRFGQTFNQMLPGTLNVRIGGITPTVAFDQYPVAQSATLNGNLGISLVNGYEPDLGDTFEIMTFSSRTGTFSNVDGLLIGNGKQFNVIYGSTNVILSVVAGP
jgi:hypothetical protein